MALTTGEPIRRCRVTSVTAARGRATAFLATLVLAGTALSAEASAGNGSWVVAVVGTTPISVQAYWHWENIARSGAPTSGPPLRPQVMSFLITAAWLIGEAQDRGISVSATQVDRTLAQVVSQQFPKPKDFQDFMRSSGMTIADLKFRVGLNLLSAAIEKQVVGGKKGTAADQALTTFVDSFNNRWLARTKCAFEFETPLCGGELDLTAARLDIAAEELARTAETAANVAAVNDGGSYARIRSPASLAAIEPAINTASNGKAYLSAARGSSRGYRVTVTSATGDQFTIRNSNGRITRTCQAGVRGACTNGPW